MLKTVVLLNDFVGTILRVQKNSIYLKYKYFVTLQMLLLLLIN